MMGVLLWVIIIGFVAGVIARLLMPGPNTPKVSSSPPSSAWQEHCLLRSLAILPGCIAPVRAQA